MDLKNHVAMSEKVQNLNYDEVMIHKDELNTHFDSAKKINHRKLKVQLVKENQAMKEIYD